MKLSAPKRFLWILAAAIVVAAGCVFISFMWRRSHTSQSVRYPVPELVLQVAHTAPATALAFSPSGRWFASGSPDRTVRLWDANTGRLLRVINVGATVEGIDIADNDRWLAINAEGRVLVRDIHTDAELRKFDVGLGKCAKFTPDSKYVVTGEMGGKDKDGRQRPDSLLLAVREISTGNTRAHLRALGGPESMSISANGRLVVAAERYGRVGIWRRPWYSEKFSLVQINRSHTGPDATVVDTSPDGNRIAVGGKGTMLELWDGAGRLLRSIKLENRATDLKFSPDGRILAVASVRKNQTLLYYDARSGDEVKAAGPSRAAIRSLAFSRDGKRLLASMADGGISVLEASSGRELVSTPRITAGAASASLSPNGRWLGIGVLHPNVVTSLWDLKTGMQVRTLRAEPGHPKVVTKVLFSGSGTVTSLECNLGPAEGFVLSVPCETSATVWDASTGLPLRHFSGAKVKLYESVNATSSDGTLAALPAGDKGTEVAVWNLESGRPKVKLRGHKQPVVWTHFLAPSSLLTAAASTGGGEAAEAAFWNIDTGRLSKPTSVADFPVSTVSADGKLWAGGFYGRALIRDLQTDKTQEFTISNPGDNWLSIMSMALSPDNRWLLAGGSQGEVRLWDTSAGAPPGNAIPSKEPKILQGSSGAPIVGLTFSSDQRWLVTTALDGAVTFWDFNARTIAATLYSMGDRDWMVITPDGMFDASPGALSKLSFRFGPDVFDVAPADAFIRDFYDPGLLSEILSGHAPKPPQNITSVDRREPQLSLRTVGPQGNEPVGSREIDVEVSLSQADPDSIHPRGSGVRDVRLFRNGSLVQAWHGDLKLNWRGRAQLRAKVPVMAGENRITAYAFNSDNVKSVDASLAVTGAESLRRKGILYLFAVGINLYQGQGFNLRYARSDAEDILAELNRRQVRLGTFRQVVSVPLLDESATRENILAGLRRLGGDLRPLPATAPPSLQSLQRAEPEDAVVVFVASHGVASGPRFYVLPHDLGPNQSRDGVDEPALAAILGRSISDLDLMQLFEAMDAGHVVLILDSCNSGQALEAEEKRRGPMNSKGLSQLAYEKGMVVLTAAQGYQAALEPSSYGHGLLTFALVEEGLKSNAADRAPKDGQVLLEEWVDYATDRVPDLQLNATPEALKGRVLELTNLQTNKVVAARPALQQPRAFYRREIDPQPLIVDRP